MLVTALRLSLRTEAWPCNSPSNHGEEVDAYIGGMVRPTPSYQRSLVSFSPLHRHMYVRILKIKHEYYPGNHSTTLITLVLLQAPYT